MDEKKKKLKAENWSSDERMGMVNSMLENFPKVSGKFSGTVLTSEKKNRAWEEVIKSINSCSVTARNETQVRKKWSEVKGAVKRKEARNRAHMRKTGGGPPPEPLEDWELKVLSLIPDSAIEGVKVGGIDTFEVPITLENTPSTSTCTSICQKTIRLPSKTTCTASASATMSDIATSTSSDGTVSHSVPVTLENTLSSTRTCEKTSCLPIYTTSTSSASATPLDTTTNSQPCTTQNEHEQVPVKKRKKDKSSSNYDSGYTDGYRDRLLDLQQEKVNLKKQLFDIQIKKLDEMKKNKSFVGAFNTFKGKLLYILLCSRHFTFPGYQIVDSEIKT